MTVEMAVKQTQTKEQTQARVWRMMRGRSIAYPTPEAFAEEALQQGISLAAPWSHPRLGDIILFVWADADVMERGKDYHTTLFGWGKVTGEALHAKDKLGQAFLENLRTRLMAAGFVTLYPGGKVVRRRCGWYEVGLTCEIHDWDGYQMLIKKTAEALGLKLGELPRHIGRLVQGEFYPLPNLPYRALRWWRGFAEVTEEELAELRELLEPVGVWDALRDTPTSGKVMELVQYVQQAMEGEGEEAKRRHRMRAALSYRRRKEAEGKAVRPYQPRKEQQAEIQEEIPEPEADPSAEGKCLLCGEPLGGIGGICDKCAQDLGLS